MKRFKSLVLLFLAFSCSLAQGPNSLTDEEKKAGWKLLFDGKSTAGWHTYNKSTIGTGWKAENGELTLDSKLKDGGDILTDMEFENFELVVEWKVGPGGNSGIIFNSVESPKYEHAWHTGPEMQVLDNERHADAKVPKHRAGNLYDLIASEVESVKPANEWNVARILSNNGHLELWLNNVKQVETTMFTPEWVAMIKGSKFKTRPDFGIFRKGRIMLQDHGDSVWFRNIKIREL